MIYIIIIATCLCFLLLSLVYKYYNKYKNLSNRIINSKDAINMRYMPITVMLQNAVVEAYNYAIETDNEFEINTYKRLIDQMKG